MDKIRRSRPTSCIVISLSEDYSEKLIATIWTLVIPRKVRQHPMIDKLLNILFKMNLESKAVKTIFPPLRICQTELSTIFKAV